MRKKQTRVTQEEISNVWGNADFGGMTRMEVIKQGILKTASGYCHGSTSTHILRNLGLITAKNRLTKRGQYNLFEFYGKGHTI